MRFLKIINRMKTLFILILILFSMQSLSAQTIDKIIAVVNGEIITQSDVNRVLATLEAEYKSIYTDTQGLEQRLKQAEENIINQMVEEKLILSEAKKSNIKIDEDAIEARIEQIKESFVNEEEFERTLEAQGLTLKDLRDRFCDQEMMKKAVDYFVKFEIKIDLIEIKQFYQTHQQELVQPEKVKVKSILIKVGESGDEHIALQKAQTILVRLKRGEDFEELAKNYSQGANAEEGGDLGFVEKGQLIKEIDESIFSLNPGEFTEVIKTPSGYRIFKVGEKKPGKPLVFSQAQDIIRQILYRKKFTEAFKKWIEKLKQNAFISIKE